MSATAVKQTILVVDDAPENIDVLSGILRAAYKVKAAINGEKALAIAYSDNPPDLILLDIMMPGMSGYEVCEKLKANLSTRRIPVIFCSAMGEVQDMKRGFSVGGVDYITKPVNPDITLARVRTHLELYDQSRVLEMKVRERTQELHDTQLAIIRCLGKAAEYKDDQTGMHVIRMSHYCHVLGLAVGMTPADAEMLMQAAPMHDVGKIGTPDHILKKPGRLEPEEWLIMQRHVENAADILGQPSSPLLRMAKVIAMHHHERWDGKGYPRGLAGHDIPLEARIAAVADVFDALTSDRPYKRAWSVEKTAELIREGAGSQFDPLLVEKMMEQLPKFVEIKSCYADAPASV